MANNYHPRYWALRLAKVGLFLAATMPLLATAGQQSASQNPKMPVCYTENSGQFFDEKGKQLSQVLFKASMEGMDMYISETGITYVLYHPQQNSSLPSQAFSPGLQYLKDSKTDFVRIDVTFNKAAISRPQIELTDESAFYSNYYSSKFPDGIKSVRNFKSVTIKGIWPGIDWHLGFTNDNYPEYDFIVHPGADASVISLQYKWADLKLDETKTKLTLSTPLCSIIEGAVKSFAGSSPVETAYALNEKTKTIHFKTGVYDHNQVLRIDPPLVLQWSLLYGTLFSNGFRGVTSDAFGHVIVTGYTSDPFFPILNPGGGAYFQGTLGSTTVTDVAIMKFTSAGTTIWATYYGGRGLDYGDGITVDRLNNVYVTGETKSADFPLQNGPAGSYNQAQSDSLYSDAFILKFDANGVRQWATCFGASGDDEGMAVATDGYDNLYMTGYTSSVITLLNPGGGAYYQNALAGGSDVLLTKFSSSGQLLWSTYYGGGSFDYGLSVHVAADHDVYICGYTSSIDFPLLNLAGAYNQALYAGGISDGFFVRFDSTGTRKWATYFGGNQDDYATCVSTTSLDQLLITGRTSSTNFPVIRDSVECSYFQDSCAGSSDAFVAEFQPWGTQVWCTYYGGSGTDGGNSITVDGYDDIFVTGYTNSADFPLYNPGPPAYFNDTLYIPYSAFMLGFQDSTCRIWGTYAPAGFEYGNSVNVGINGEIYLAAEGDIFNGGGGGGGGGGGIDSFGNGYGFGGASGGGVAAFNGFGWGNGGWGGGGWGGGGGGYGPCLLIHPVLNQAPCDSACNGQGTVYAYGGIAPFTYSWSNGQATQTINNLCEGNYIVTVTDATGCWGIAFLDALPLWVSMLNYQNERCSGISHDGWIEASANFGTGQLTYLWSTGQTTADITNLSAGTYTLTVTDKAGCSATLSQTISGTILNNRPGIDSCNASGVVLSADLDTSSARQGYTYQWANGTWGLTFLADSTGLYSVQITDSTSGCQIDTAIAVNYPLITDSIFFTNPLCYGMQTGSISAIINCVQCLPPLNYKWSNGSTDSALINLSAGTYTITVSDSRKCAFTNTVNITQPPALLIDSVVTSPQCFGDSNGLIVLHVSGGQGPGYNFAWSNNPLTSDSVNASLKAGNYAVTVTDANNCIDSLNFNVTQPAILQVNFNTHNINCYGIYNGFAVAQVSGGIGGYTYSWNTFPAQTSDTALNLRPGNYSVSITDAYGCSVIGTDTIVSPASALQINAAQVINPVTCYNHNDAEIKVTATGGTRQYSYSLSDNAGFTTQSDSIFIAASSGTDSVFVTDAMGCTYALAVLVEPFVRSNSTVTTNPASCFGKSDGDLNINSQPADRNPYTYSLKGASPQANNVFYNLPAGNYQLVVLDNNNCADTLSETITQPDSIDGRVWLNGTLLPQDTSMMSNETLATFSKPGSAEWSVVFNPNQSLIAGTDSMVQIHPEATTQYTVTLYGDSTAKNCTLVYTGLIVVQDNPDFPNLITPNNDGINDKWDINLFKYPNSSVTIFDRWGEIVFTTSNYENTWDGTNQKTGKHLADGAYYFILASPTQNGSSIYKGDINVLSSIH